MVRALSAKAMAANKYWHESPSGSSRCDNTVSLQMTSITWKQFSVATPSLGQAPQELFRLCRSFRTCSFGKSKTLNRHTAKLHLDSEQSIVKLQWHDMALTSMQVTNSSRSIGEENTKFIRLGQSLEPVEL